MTLDELNSIEDKIRKEADEKTRKARVEYAKANQKFKIGDILIDHAHTVLVESAHVDMNFSSPTTVYRGVRLKKDLKPFKSGEIVSVWEDNVKTCKTQRID